MSFICRISRKFLKKAPVVDSPDFVDTSYSHEVAVYEEDGFCCQYDDPHEAMLAVADLCKDEHHAPIHVHQ